MSNHYPLTTLLVVCCFLAACAKKDPNDIPEQLNLYQLEPVVALVFDANPDTYELQAFAARGRPTSSLIKDRDVRIVGRDAQGRELHSLSVINPRMLESLEAPDPKGIIRSFVVAPKGNFVVFLPRDEAVRTVEVEVLRGPNAPLKRSFSVKPSELPPFSHKAADRRPPRPQRRVTPP